MAYGVIGTPGFGNANQPSPTIWGDCPNQELLDEATGLFVYHPFMDDASLPGLPNSAAAGHAATYAYNTAYDTALQITTGGTTGDGAMIFTRPLGPIQAGSGKKFWAEVDFALNSVTATNGFFFGLIGGPVVVSGSLKAGGLPVAFNNSDVKSTVVTNVSTTRATNTITTNSLIGIVGTPTGSGGQVKFDALYLNQPTYSATATALPATTSTAKTKGSVIYIQTDLLNSPSILANLGANGTVSTSANGTVVTTTINGFPGDLTAYQATPGTTAGVNNGFVKLGIRFDGQQFLYFYVNGVQAAKVTVDSTFDQVSDYGVALSLTDGNSAAVVAQVDFFRAAAKVV